MKPSLQSIAARTIAPRLVPAALLSALVWLAGLHGAEAGVNVWTTHGPWGASIFALAIDPQTPTTLYAGTGAGVYTIQQRDGAGQLASIP